MEYEIRRSNRKTTAIQVSVDGRVTVRAPLYMPDKAIRDFVTSKEPWIDKQLERFRLMREERLPVAKLTDDEVRRLADDAVRDIPQRVARFAPKVGVTFGRITIRNQLTRWGSCSAKGNLNFNCLLMLTPPEIRDYVVVHELCHRKELNHSKRFWREVANVMPDYRERERWLKNNGGALIERIK